MYGEPQPYWEQSKEVAKEDQREHVLGEGLNEWELSEIQDSRPKNRNSAD